MGVLWKPIADVNFEYTKKVDAFCTDLTGVLKFLICRY